MKNWGVIGGIAAALAAGIYVIWGPITERKKRRKGKKAPVLWAAGSTQISAICSRPGNQQCFSPFVWSE